MSIGQPQDGESLSPIKFEVRNLSDRLTDVLRDIIVTGDISPDVPIRQDALAARLQVSKIPLREALTRLEQDGLVVSHPNRGFYVTPLSREEAEEVYDLRLKLEPEAAARACESADDAEREKARAILNLLDREAAEGKPTVGALNRAFHLALVAPGRRPVTTRLLTRLHIISDRYVCKHLEPSGSHIRAEEEHEQILAMWLARKPEKVERLIRQHLELTLKDLREELGQDVVSAPAETAKTPRARARTKR